ncbi:MAG: hypothetical protein WD876_01155 [Candidatus Pacearchaeota archaeon]
MAKVKIIDSLAKEIQKKFKGKSLEIVKLLRALEKNPYKGEAVGQVAGIVIKELRYEGFRFYFITDGYQIRVLSIEGLTNLLIKFVRMSDKKSQQKTINEIKDILRKFGSEGFE